MKSHPILTLTPNLYICCLFFLLSHLTIATSTPVYNPVEYIVVNCGSPGSLKGNDDRDWIGDKGSKFAPIEELNHKSDTSEAQSQVSAETVPYTTARLSYWQFTYVFPVTPGPKFVRLYFNSAVYSGFESSKDFFTVKAGSFTLLRNFSASTYTNLSDQKKVYKEFCISVDKYRELNLTFIPFTSTSMNYHAFISGIEIVSMPMDLYYKPQGVIKGEEFVPVYVGQPNPIYIDYSMALEMVYRLNAGGSAIQVQDDTGMFREWSEGRDYVLSGAFVPRDPSLKLKYTKIPNYTAPDAVYQSAISMGPDRTKNMQSNLTWGLPVDTGFNYLVRLHFCEIESEIHASGNREFYIYIDHQLAEERADVLLWTDDNDTPYYKDYVVMIKNKGNDTHLLSIDLHPRLDAQLIDAILNGVEVFKLSDSDNNLAGANIAAPLHHQPQPAGAANESKSKKTTTFIAIGSVLGLLVVLTLVCCMVLCILKKTKHYGSYHPSAKWWWWSRPDPYKREFSRRARRLIGNEESHTPFPSDNLNKVQELPLFNFEMLVNATNDFHLSNKLGQGGFGPVYKGKLSDGQEIAVKRLSRTSAQGLKEFMNEVVVISKLQHRNLVRLLGCCVEGEERMLLYEYMPNKSLDAFLFDPHKERLLDWKKRFNIIEGIGRGLLYLHRDSRLRIIHRDLKASNILLDKELNPKISDFGMARIFGNNEDQANTNRVVGTYGYMSPEYAMEGRFSEKSDVFSFGVLLLEIVNGRRNTSFYNDEQSQSLLGLAWKLWNADNAIALINPMIYEPCFEIEIFRCIQVGLLCVQEFAQDRPTVSVVVSMLKSEIGNLPPPMKPAFTEKLSALNTVPSKCFQTKCSVNNVTVSMLQGR